MNITKYWTIVHPTKNLYLKNGQSTNFDYLRDILDDYGYDLVRISKELFDFLIEKSKTSNEKWLDIDDYKPTPIKLKFATLTYNEDKLKQREEVFKKLQEEDDFFKNLKNNDRKQFIPWTPITKDLYEESSNRKLIVLEEDDKNLDTTGIYQSPLNANNNIEGVTNHKEINDYYTRLYGVSDNATQVIKLIDQAIHDYQFSNNAYPNFLYGEAIAKLLNPIEDIEFILLLTPIFRNETDGWRWHK